MPPRARKRRARADQPDRSQLRATRTDDVWAVDFQHDQTADGRMLRSVARCAGHITDGPQGAARTDGSAPLASPYGLPSRRAIRPATGLACSPLPTSSHSRWTEEQGPSRSFTRMELSEYRPARPAPGFRGAVRCCIEQPRRPALPLPTSRPSHHRLPRLHHR